MLLLVFICISTSATFLYVVSNLKVNKDKE